MLRPLSVVLVAAALPAQAVGQTLVGLDDPVTQADLLYFADEPEEALAVLTEHLLEDPADYEALWRAARAGVVAGLLREDDGNTVQNRFLDPALEHGRRAVALRPDRSEGVYWRGVAAGCRAMNARPSYAAELAQISYDDAQTLLTVDPAHAGAHHMLGILYYVVMSVSRVERFVARLVMDHDVIDQASWERAESHLVRAVESAPADVLYRYNLATLYEKRGRKHEATVQLHEALRLPPVHPIDAQVKHQADSVLAEIGRPR